MNRVAALDGMREVAILLVVPVHSRAVRAGLLGVNRLLVLSGFLITTLPLLEHARSKSVSLTGFSRRRAVRQA